jgi:lipid-A-disaccharide synthase-like uncharacterized protein
MASSLADPTPEAKRKRTKWEPAVLMAIVLGLGLWIAFGPASKPQFPIARNNPTAEVRVGNTRYQLEAFKPAGASEYSFRQWYVNGPNPPTVVMTRAEADAFYGRAAIDEMLTANHTWIFRFFRFLNITSWPSLVWVGIGFLGQLAFSGRMILQWIVSERHRRSVITESFWWFSLFGGITLFSYFVWRQDPIGILGQASGVVIYARNIRLLRKHARRAGRDGTS